jgi:hypothetical protein
MVATTRKMFLPGATAMTCGRPFLWPDVLDDLNQLVRSVPVAACELDEFACPLHDGSALGRSGDRNATSAPELEQPLVPEKS